MAEKTILVQKRKLFYGYIIIGTCFLLMLVVHGLQNSYSVFFNSLQTELATNRTIISSAQSLAFFFTGLFAIFAGRLTDRFGPRLVMVVCGALLGLGYLLLSRLSSVWQLYLFYSVMVGVGTSSGDVVLLSTIARWFSSRLGTMSGIAKVGTGAGLAIVPLTASLLIANYSWQNAYLFLGIGAIVSTVILAQLLKRDPGQMGLRAYGDEEKGSLHTSLAGLTFKEAIHTRQLWLVSAVYFTIWYCCLTITTHTVPNAVDLGIPAAQAASIVSLIGVASIVGRVIMGVASDKIGNSRALSICLLVLVAALSWLQFSRNLGALYLFATIYGFSHGGFFAIISPLIASLFGKKSHGTILGMVLFLGTVGGAIGPIIAGSIFDTRGSYQLAFLILLIASITGFIVSIMVRPIQTKKAVTN